MKTTKQSFGEWKWKAHDEVHLGRGSGVRNAFDTGAMYAMRGEPYNNIYRRTDCYLAFEQGYNRMQIALKTTVFICDCCHSEIDRRVKS